MSAAHDFNYKVALAEGLKKLQAGRLRQAEEQFRYLTSKFPTAEGGYRGLAKVLIELEDRTAAIASLRDGAAALAGGGERLGAIALLREAVALDPLDLVAHRRLAAGLALAGRPGEAAAEYARFAELHIAGGDQQRARTEVSYALETIGPIGPLGELATRLGVQRTAREATERGGLRAEVEPAALRGPIEMRAEPASLEREGHPAPSASAATAVAALTPQAEADLEERAQRLIAARDPGAPQVALQAARVHLVAGRVNAASDLLLQLVAARIADHDAQRLLVDVARSVNRPDVAREKCELLAQALLLTGRGDLAREVERLGTSI